MTLREVDVLIVGAGPSGLTASVELNRRGINTVVVDEYPVAGGRLLGQLYQVKDTWWKGREVAESLSREIEQLGCAELLLGTSVVGIEREKSAFHVTLSTGLLRASVVLIATGATEVPVLVDNWTLPGVMSIGAAQVMANVYGVKPGEKGIIIGTGPLAFAVAEELHWLNVNVAGIFMAPGFVHRPLKTSLDDEWAAMADLLHLAPRWVKASRIFLRSAAMRARIMAWTPRGGIAVAGTRLHPNVVAVKIEGHNQVESVTLRQVNSQGELLGAEQHLSVDFVALSGGLRPIPDLFQAVGAEMHYSPGGLFDIPLFGSLGETTVPGLYAAGNALGIEGARVAMAQGRVAALGMYQFLQGPNTVHSTDIADAKAALNEARAGAPLVFSRHWSSVHETVKMRWDDRRKETDRAL